MFDIEETKSSPPKGYSKPSGCKVCVNQFCPNGSQGKLSKVKMSAGFKWMCGLCEKAFKNNQFCSFCETLYFLEAGSDNKVWIGCDLCDRWVHMDCDERLSHLKQASIQDIEYVCPHCDAQKKGKRKIKDGNPKKKVKRGDPFLIQMNLFRSSFLPSTCRDSCSCSANRVSAPFS